LRWNQKEVLKSPLAGGTPVVIASNKEVREPSSSAPIMPIGLPRSPTTRGRSCKGHSTGVLLLSPWYPNCRSPTSRDDPSRWMTISLIGPTAVSTFRATGA
jgi:hypothetical protein